MAKYRKISTAIHNDEKFRSLSDRAQLLFYTLITHPFMTPIGAMRGSIEGLWAEQRKWDLEAFREAFREVCAKGMVKYDEQACLIWLPKFLKHNPPESPNVTKSWIGGWETLPECPLLWEVLDAVESFVRGLSEAFSKAFEEAFAEVFAKACRHPSRNQEQEQEQEQEYLECPDGHLSSVEPDDVTAQEEPAREDSAPKRAQADNCPHEQIIELYHSVLPNLPPVRIWNEPCRKTLRTRWREDPQRQSLDWWRGFFQRVSRSDFLTGRVNEFQATLAWLVGPKNFAKVMNGQYENRGPRSGSTRTDRNMRTALEWAGEK